MQHDRHALLIDGMGTLVSLDAPVAALVKVLEHRFGIAVSDADARHALGAEIAFYRTHMDLGRDAESLTLLRARCARVLFDALPVTVSADDDARTEALLQALRFTAFDDARAALMAARGHGARVVVVSNWDVSLFMVLELVGLAPLVDAVVTSAAVGARKPEPAIFALALALAGVAPGEALHVGDNRAQDVAGARALGIAPVLLRRDGSREAGVRTIASLAELSWP